MYISFLVITLYSNKCLFTIESSRMFTNDLFEGNAFKVLFFLELAVLNILFFSPSERGGLTAEYLDPRKHFVKVIIYAEIISKQMMK